MLLRKSHFILWLILWAEADRPAQAEIPAQLKNQSSGGARSETFAQTGEGVQSKSSVHRNTGISGRNAMFRNIVTSDLDSLGEAWKSIYSVPLLERAEALTLAYDAWEARHFNSSLVESYQDSRNLLSKRAKQKWFFKAVGKGIAAVGKAAYKAVGGCENTYVTCPANVMDEEVDGGAERSWKIVRSQKLLSKFLMALSLAGAVLVGILAGPLAGLAVAGGAIAARALWSAGSSKPACPLVDFERLLKADCRGWGCKHDVQIKLPYLTLAMTMQFVASAVETEDDEAMDWKAEAARNGRGIFACNVLMYTESLWDVKLGNSELFVEDPIRDASNMNEAEQAEEAYKRSLDADPPKELALQHCRYLLCKHAHGHVDKNPLRGQ